MTIYSASAFFAAFMSCMHPYIMLGLRIGILANSMLFRVPLLLIQAVATSFVLWICLSTALPQITERYKSGKSFVNEAEYPYIPVGARSTINNSEIYFIIAHPDDEVMFFLPSLIELSRPSHHNNVHLLCLSTGDAAHPSMGPIRSNELRRSALILGLPASNVIVTDLFKDGMNENWDPAAMEAVLKKHVKSNNARIVTFDEDGISGHANHISLFHGVSRFVKSHKKQGMELYVLKSVNFLEKYSFTMLTNIELIFHHLSKLIIGKVFNVSVNISVFKLTIGKKSLQFYSDLNMLSVSYAAMAYGHYSQMVWFRYGWLIFSRYLNYNQLIQVE